MADQAIRIEKLTPHVGAEVRGVDLARPLDERTVTPGAGQHRAGREALRDQGRTGRRADHAH